MKLLILFGPPAVGKATIGRIIESQSSFKLFHNHMVMDGVMHIFGRNTPSEDKLSRIIRLSIIEEAAVAGVDLIFTYVWNFGHTKGKHNIDAYKQAYESRGGEVRFVELTAPAPVRAERANSAERYLYKTHAPSSAEVIQLEATRNFTSPAPFFYPDIYKHIDTTSKPPEATAQEIIDWLEQ